MTAAVRRFVEVNAYISFQDIVPDDINASDPVLYVKLMLYS